MPVAHLRSEEMTVRAKLLHRGRGERTLAVVFDPGDEVVRGLEDVAQSEGLSAAHLTAIGAFRSVTLGFFELERRDYRRNALHEQCEVVSLVGNVALDGERRKIHAHAVVGRKDGTTLGGHLLEAWVEPTLEAIILEAPRHLRRKRDPRTGLPLLDLAEERP